MNGKCIYQHAQSKLCHSFNQHTNRNQYQMFNHAPMYCNNSYQEFNQCANASSYNQHANSFENTNIGIISNEIYQGFNHNTYISSWNQCSSRSNQRTHKSKRQYITTLINHETRIHDQSKNAKWVQIKKGFCKLHSDKCNVSAMGISTRRITTVQIMILIQLRKTKFSRL